MTVRAFKSPSVTALCMASVTSFETVNKLSVKQVKPVSAFFFSFFFFLLNTDDCTDFKLFVSDLRQVWECYSAHVLYFSI
jgi:hypothetical protein